MEIWFLHNMRRLSQERTAIQHLEETTEWLKGTNWALDGNICVDAVICAHGHEYQVRMSYPSLFPHVPPIVRPRNLGERWSNHQYSDGTLCLEWGPDTWHPDVTGARVLESVYKLLDIENPYGSGPQNVALSRHHLSIGQTLRSSYGRFYVGEELANYLVSLPAQSIGLLDFSIQLQNQSFLVLIQQIQITGQQTWEDTSIPPGVSALGKKKGTTQRGIFCKTSLNSSVITSITEAKKLGEILSQVGQGIISLTGEENIRVMGLEHSPVGVMLLDSDSEPYFFVLLDLERGKITPLAPVWSGRAKLTDRFPFDSQELSTKSVGIVGLGSIGSKMALSLARTGVSRFFLVDEDVFLPENVCRHVLDWRNVGEHKVDAVAEVLSYIAPNIEVNVSRLNLTGQEATSSLSGTLNKLGQCDLLIDATADFQVFNLVAAIATTYARPLVWMEVYAGGIGGMLARSRPGQDPDPHTMRAAYHGFTLEAPKSDLLVAYNYMAEDRNGNILSASDADVGILACHATRLAIDTLLKREPSIFPYSMYMVGLARSWIFEAPFHTIPIETNHLVHEQEADLVPDEALMDSITFLTNLLENRPVADTPS